MPIFEHETPELIRSRILKRMDTTLQTREGSFSYDMTSPVSFEIWRLLMTLDELIDAFYVNKNSGKYLDSHADLLGLSRRLGTRAYATIRFTGKDGVTIPAGTAFFTAAGLQFDTVYDVVLENGEGIGYLQAAEVGEWYNVEAGEVSLIQRNISGLETYTNEAAEGGTDPESDAMLFERIENKRKNPSTSGNENHYKEWALSCDGVGDVKVTGLWNGPGTVRVLVVGYDWRSVDESIVDGCYEYIQTQRPIGADVTVVSAVDTEIVVSAKVIAQADMTPAAIQSAFVSKLDTYLQNLAAEYFESSKIFPYTLRYNMVAALLMGIDGVIDFSELLINGGTENIVIDGTSVPTPGEVTVECVS